MTAFRFRLQRLLDLRSRSEREQAQALHAASRREEHALAGRRAAAEHLERCGDRRLEAAGAPAPAGLLRGIDLTVAAAATSLRAAAAKADDAATRRVQEEARFAAVRQARRVVERLRDRDSEAWAIEASRHEQRTLDEVAARRRTGNAP